MTINENLTEFAGKPVKDWTPDTAKFDPAKIHYRLRLAYDDIEEQASWVNQFMAYLDQAGVEQTTGFVVGMWGENWSGDADTADNVIEALVAARDKLPKLKALFVGDIISEENEISWINQGDISPLFQAYPDLEILTVRGGDGLRVGRVQHAKLK